jgi:hypothetical protein
MQLTLVVKLEILQQSISESKYPPVYYGKLIFRPTLLYCCCLDNIPALLMHIQLHEPIILLVLVLDQVQLVLVQPIHVANVPEPRVQQAHVFGRHGGFDTTTAVVTADDNVFYFEVTNGVVHDGHDVEVNVIDEVGDVAVDEHLTRFKAGDGFSGDARVGAACVIVLVCVHSICAGDVLSHKRWPAHVPIGGIQEVILRKIEHLTILENT